MAMRSASLLCLSFLPLALLAAPAPEVVKLATGKSASKNCVSAIPAWNFGPHDEAVHISFGVLKVTAGMRFRIQVYQDVDQNFAADSAELYGEAVTNPEPEAGDYCYSASLGIKGETFSELAGEWTIKLAYDDGSGFVPFNGVTTSFNIAPEGSSSDVLLSVPEIDGSAQPRIKLIALPRDRMGKALPSLSSSNFALTDNGTRQEVTVRPMDDSDRYSIAMIVDSSTPVTGKLEPYGHEKAAAKRFISELRSNDEVAVYAVGGKVTRVQDSTQDANVLAGAIDNLPEGDGTPLYKAISEAAGYLSARQGHRAIVLLTGGYNQGEDTTTFEDAVRAANAAGVPVVAAGFGAARHHVLDMMALKTNGLYAAAEQSKDYPDLLANVAKTIRAAYEMSFMMADPASEHTLVLTAEADGKQSEPVTKKAGPFGSGSGAVVEGAGKPRQGKMVFEMAGKSQFVLMNLVSGSIKELGFRGYQPALSPDGRKLAYRDTHDQLRVRNLETGEEVLLTVGERDEQYSPTFVGNDTIAYLRENRQGVEICLSPIDRINERVWKGKIPLERLSGSYMDLEWVPGSGTQNPSFVLSAASSGLYWLSSDSSKRLTPEAMEARYPSVNRDGTRVLFESDNDVYSVPVAGGDLQRLTKDRNSGWPVWSPDGLYLAYITTSAVDRGGQTGIGSFLNKIVIMDPSGVIADVLQDSDGKIIQVPGDRITWR